MEIFQGLKTGVLVHKAIYYMNDDKVIDQVIVYQLESWKNMKPAVLSKRYIDFF